MPAPYRLALPLGRALADSAPRTASASVTPSDSIIAATPATCGEAMLVPLKVPKISHLSLPPLHTVCCVTATPGAAMATCGPREENHAIWSLSSVALTAKTPGYAAGYPTLRPLLPAAATTTTP